MNNSVQNLEKIGKEIKLDLFIITAIDFSKEYLLTQGGNWY